jgi:sugar phosphate permease
MENPQNQVSLPLTPLEDSPTTFLLPAATEKPSRFYIPKRFILLAMCFVGMIICYADRTNFSVAVIPMVKQYGWDKTLEGVVLSGFWYGYAITQVPGGYLSDKYSGKTVLSVAVVLWSLCTVVTPPAAQAGIVPLFITRLLMGNLLNLLMK